MCLLTLRNGNTAGGRIVTGGSFTGHGSKVWSSRRASKGEALAVRTKMAVVCLPGCVPVQQHQSRWPAGCYILKYSNEANIVISLLRDGGVRIDAIVSISESRQGYQCTNEKAALWSCFAILLPLFMLVGFQVWMLLLLFGRDSLSLVRSTIFVCSFRARLDAHGRSPLSLCC